jgi:MOSC domain-containing protein YiiM
MGEVIEGMGMIMAKQTGVLEIVSVNVALPSVLVSRPSGDVISGIDKRPVTAPTLRLTHINLEGDGQADTKISRFGGQVHGGPDQAVYAFPAAHYPVFEAALGRSLSPGFVGENLTIGSGVTEADVCIGDIWAWGDARLEVASPRSPCYKLGIRMGRQALRRWLREDGLVGWYLRVLRQGTVPTSGEIVVESRHPAGVSVLEVHHALQSTAIGPGHLQDLAPLAEKARHKLQVAGRDLTGGVPERDV